MGSSGEIDACQECDQRSFTVPEGLGLDDLLSCVKVSGCPQGSVFGVTVHQGLGQRPPRSVFGYSTGRLGALTSPPPQGTDMARGSVLVLVLSGSMTGENDVDRWEASSGAYTVEMPTVVAKCSY